MTLSPVFANFGVLQVVDQQTFLPNTIQLLSFQGLAENAVGPLAKDLHWAGNLSLANLDVRTQKHSSIKLLPHRSREPVRLV